MSDEIERAIEDVMARLGATLDTWVEESTTVPGETKTGIALAALIHAVVVMANDNKIPMELVVVNLFTVFRENYCSQDETLH